MTGYALGRLLATLLITVAFFLVVRLTPLLWGMGASPRRGAVPPRPEEAPREASHPA
jgi:hypothetical protein